MGVFFWQTALCYNCFVFHMLRFRYELWNQEFDLIQITSIPKFLQHHKQQRNGFVGRKLVRPAISCRVYFLPTTRKRLITDHCGRVSPRGLKNVWILWLQAMKCDCGTIFVHYLALGYKLASLKRLSQGCQTRFSSGDNSGKFNLKRAGPM